MAKSKTRAEVQAEVARIVSETWGADPWSNPEQARLLLEALRLLLDLRRTRDAFPDVWPVDKPKPPY